MNRRAWVLFILVGIIWGFPYLLIRIAIRELTPETMILFRSVLSFVALLPFSLGAGRFGLVLRHWFALVSYTACEIAIPWYLLAQGEIHVTSSTAGLIIATVPLFGLLLALVYRTEQRVSPIRLIGLLVGLAGVVTTVGLDIRGANLFSAIEILVAAFGYALGPTIFNQYLSDIPPVTVIVASFAVASLVYLPFGLTHLPPHISLEVAGAIAGLALVCSLSGFILFFRLIHEIGPARATVVTYLNPIIAVIAGVIVLGEPFSNGLAFGLPLVIVGSVLATWASSHERSLDHENPPANLGAGTER